jgi:histidinol-phosphatase (PHP family)
MIPDYHIHTRLCRHAEGGPREYVERAIAEGMSELGFADHLPFLAGWTPAHVPADDWAMEMSELDDYVTLVQGLRDEYQDDLRILLGIEADFIRETSSETAQVLGDYPFDYVIGSVHVVGERYPFDHPAMRERLSAYGVDRIYLESLDLVAEAAASSLFTVMGHIDQAKKFGYRPGDEEAVSAAASTALRAIAAAGTALELNTAGLRAPVAEAYPAPALLREAAGLGIPLTFGSDAHEPGHVGAGFATAAAAARTAGYASTLRLGDRVLEPLL